MFDHLTIGVQNLARSTAFYDRAMAPLFIRRLFDDGERVVAYGRERPQLWLAEHDATRGKLHIALVAATRADVDAFHAAALAVGGRDNGAPGLRPEYHPAYYGAFVLDPDGHNIEAVHGNARR